MMEFLVQFELNIPDGVPESEVEDRERAEAAAAETLAGEGHLVRLWQAPVGTSRKTVLGLYRAGSKAELNGLLGALPLYEWMRMSITPLVQHPNDPMRSERSPNDSAGGRCTTTPNGPNQECMLSERLPEPRLTKIFRLEASLGEALDLGNVAQGRRRIVPLTGGTFVGPELNGALLPGASADWQIVLSDGTALGDIRFTLQTDRGDLLYVRSQGVRHGSAEVLARLSRGEEVSASEYVFRTSTQVETAAPDLDWLNKGVFISVAGRRVGGVVYEVYLVG
jgi:muconolactone delta-isomerase